MTTTQQVFVLIGPLAGQTVPVNGHQFTDGKMTYVGSQAQVDTLARILRDYGVVKEGEELNEGNGDMSTQEVADPARAQADYTDGRKISGAEAGSVPGAIDDLQTDRQDRVTEGGEVVKADPDAKPSGEAQEIVPSEDGSRLVLTEPTTSTTQPQDTPATPAEQAAAQVEESQTEGEESQTEGDDGKKPEAGVTSESAPAPAPSQDDSAKPSLGEAIGQLDPETDAHWTSNNLPAIDYLSSVTGTKVTRADVDAIAAGYTRAKARQARQ